MFDRPLFVIRLHPSIVVSSTDEAVGILGIFCAFGWLLGVLRALFAHDASFFFALRTSGQAFSS